MRTFNYSEIRNQKWDSDILGLIAAIYKEAGKQELYLKQKPQGLEKLVEIAKIQSTEASNAIEGIITTSTRIKQLVEEKTTPKNRDEQEIAGYRDVLNIFPWKQKLPRIRICITVHFPRHNTDGTKAPKMYFLLLNICLESFLQPTKILRIAFP